MGVKMEVNISTHLKVLYVFVFGLYFGFFVLLYCNYATWWKVEHFNLKDNNVNSDDIRHADIPVVETDFIKETKRSKRSHVYTRESRSSSLPTDKGLVQECAFLTNICKEKIRALPGPKGEKGNTGSDGGKGEYGISGMTGPMGPAGPPGNPGPPGHKGDTGDRGIIGPMGPKGIAGRKGEIGEPGEDGIPGKRGRRGNEGPRGQKGNEGREGLHGPPGPQGEKGETGERGEPGYGIHCNCTNGEKGNEVQSHIDSKTTETTPTTPMTTTTIASTTTTAIQTSPSPKLPPRKTDLKIEMTGIPLFLRQSGPTLGCWMRDSILANNYYVTYDYYGRYVYEYSSSQNFESAQIDRTHDLRHHYYYGNSHVVYNRSLYYQRAGENTIARFDFALGDIDTYERIQGASYNDSNYLYSGSRIYFDIEIDENGMWIIYRKPNDINSTYITKIDPLYMKRVKTWRIDVNSSKYGNGFIAHGVLYLIKDKLVERTTIDYAYDLYEDKIFNVKVKEFINPYRYNTMINYFPRSNPKNSRLLSWDNGVQLEYQLLFKRY